MLTWPMASLTEIEFKLFTFWRDATTLGTAGSEKLRVNRTLNGTHAKQHMNWTCTCTHACLYSWHVQLVIVECKWLCNTSRKRPGTPRTMSFVLSVYIYSGELSRVGKCWAVELSSFKVAWWTQTDRQTCVWKGLGKTNHRNVYVFSGSQHWNYSSWLHMNKHNNNHGEKA